MTSFSRFVSSQFDRTINICMCQSLRNFSERRLRQLLPVTLQGGVGSRCSPRRRARCNRHEARAGIVALTPSCLVRLSNGGLGPPSEIVSLPACTWRSICCGAASANRLTRWFPVVISEAAAKHCFSLCSTEHPFQIQNLSIFHATQRTWPTDKPPLSRLQKISSPRASVSLLVLQLYRYSIGFPHVWRTIFAILRTPTRLVTTPHFFAVIQTTVTRLLSQNATLHTEMHVVILLTGFQISFRSVGGYEGRKS